MTKIEWTHRPGTKGETWNPIVGCSITSPGCTNCYAMSMAARIERMSAGANAKRTNPHHGGKTFDAAGSHYAGTTKLSKAGPVWTGKVALAPEHILTAPLRATKPRTYFVNSMGDLFHEDVPRTWIERVFAVMALCPQHTFIMLTKRAALMFDFISHADEGDTLDAIATEAARLTGSPCAAATVEDAGWPLPNVWLGVSTERQQEADERIPYLLVTPAAVRFISAEPLLGPLDLTRLNDGPAPGTINALTGDAFNGSGDRFQVKPWTSLDWVIVGGESGPGARPMHPDWALSLRDQCTEAGVPFFFKQWGEWVLGRPANPGEDLHRSPTVRVVKSERGSIDALMERVGKARAGRLLDGREHTEWPSAAPAEKESV